jgi:predicted ATPase/class 3 adenylate cyclase/DNA-binding CsgD family transcriptional regulator
MICLTCHYANEDDARFCEQCGQPLSISCPACGSPANAGARFCRHCGQHLSLSPGPAPVATATALPPPRPLSLDERLDQLQRYLPAHLADKILASRGRLAGERKLVTVLFADIAGYTALSAQVGEEALFALMDELYELLIHEVHRYEGTVNELTGDGLVAFFGAPLAVEQAPQRAIRAAVALQQAVMHYSVRVERERGMRLQLRVGLNTGPVIVGTVGNNLRMDYKAIGNTVNLAARMEQTAVPGTIQLTEHTYKLIAGYFDCDDMGLVSVKGLAGKVRAYQVRGERGSRARIDVARERGFTRLVGRERELASLRHCFALAQEGRGQAVSIIGDAGLGKSRLLYEFRQTLAGSDCTWLDGRCYPYGAGLAYLPVIDLVKQYCRIDASDRDEDIRRKVYDGLEQLGMAPEGTAPYLLHLLAVETEGDVLVGPSPEAVKHQTFEALQGLVGEIAARGPLVLAIEDLHWADATSVEFLAFLLEHMGGSRILLVCTYRPDFASLWSGKSYHSVVTLPPLAPSEGRQMLTALLGTTHIQDELAALVLAKADGVPFFLEELVKVLQETSAIEQHEGQWRLMAQATGLPVPNTVEEVLMARIDRLAEGTKSMLQMGAVVGRECSGELLRELAGLPEGEFRTHLAALTRAELLYERGRPPQITYLFKHALTQEVAYQSLLTAQRRELHHRVAVTLETLFVDRLEEYYGQLAHHYCEAAQEDEVTKAVEYAVRAGERHMALPAYAEAVRFYHMALDAFAHQALVDEAQRCSLLLVLGEAQRKASEHVQALATLQRAAENARRLGSSEYLAQAAMEFERVTWLSGLPTEPAVHLLEEALQELGEDHRTLRARALGSLARALLFTGAQEQATRYAQQAVEVARDVDDPGALAFALQTLLLVPWKPTAARERLLSATEMVQLAEAAGDSELILEAHTQRMLSLLDLGDIQEVDVENEARARLTEELQQPSYLSVTIGVQAMRALLDGRFMEAERLALQAQDIGQRVQSDRMTGAFGVQMFTLRREQGRLREVEPALRYFVKQHGAASAWRPGLALLYSELGREREARTAFEHLAQHDFADLPRDALWMGCIIYLAEVCAFLGDTVRAATLYKLLLPYAGHTVVVGGGVVCYGAASRYLGMLAATMERWEDAMQHFEDALAMNTRMGARPWLAHTQHQYAVMLLARHQPGDRDQAMSLLHEALATARALGMHALEGRITIYIEPHPASVPAAPAVLDDLSQREVEVLHLLAAGKSNREIADALCISLNTVATHVRNILIKTGTANRTEAAAYALRRGLQAE